MEQTFDYQAISKAVGFYRRHHRVPEQREVATAAEQAANGEIRGAIQLLDWSRHCFYVKTERERVVMELIFSYVKEFCPSAAKTPDNEGHSSRSIESTSKS
ncbi:hypothetical protein [Paenibacillus sp.]|uniref:hypothetical protein n=1 Tax=Paenibacillus sp. TaxID=58172 RepID=UPI002D64A52A|nr:hypothetical protein [Paenibacillus sp.]HZG85999.1 hypothetical protein [Paenibacillus sp.]